VTLLPRRDRCPVLVYHRVADDGGGTWCIPRARFEAQMRWLADRRFAVVPAGRAAPPAPRTVALTFDDGYLDTYTTAFPILERLGFTATVFVVTGSVGGMTGSWGPAQPVPLLTWRHAQEMASRGFSFQSHTRSHPALPACTDARLAEELSGSRAELEDRLGAPVDELAYPFGLYDRRTLALVARAGYRRGWAVGLARGTPLTRERFVVAGSDGLAMFALKASGWAAGLRRSRHAVRGWIR
jgi:peptidoglycan/xylan/chitin deacetylase (PgdA/CDA1 family)